VLTSPAGGQNQMELSEALGPGGKAADGLCGKRSDQRRQGDYERERHADICNAFHGCSIQP